MAYRAEQAVNDLLLYLDLSEDDITYVEGTRRRGFIISLSSGERAVIFAQPIACRVDPVRQWLDTRDSAPAERNITWQYAQENKLKYFFLGVNSESEYYVNRILSLESNESVIDHISGTENGRRSASGTQINLPPSLRSVDRFTRVITDYGVTVSVMPKDYIKTYLETFDNRPYMDSHLTISIDNHPQNEEENPDDEVFYRGEYGFNVLLYGVPGCGKSHEINTKYCSDKQYMRRVVFHPDYTYSDFVGQILPSKRGDNIVYDFEPGPFTKILRDAHQDRDHHMYYLVIEEINRGNAPAIFGEIFQLLDRPNGTSDYGIRNADIAMKVYGNPDIDVVLPDNLIILATMNTADQNVFTLDTAFKRRWAMRSIKNTFDENDEIAMIPVCGTNVVWKDFMETINNEIINRGEDNLGSEDNRLGTHFVTIQELTDKTAFAEKVLMYLWNDAFKYARKEVFITSCKTLEELITSFEENLLAVFQPGIRFPQANVTMEERTTEPTTDNPVTNDNPITDAADPTETENA